MATFKILFFLTLWLYTSTAFDAASDRSVSNVLSRIEDELGELRKQNAAMESEIKELKERDARHSGRILVLEARENELTEELNELRKQVDKMEYEDIADRAATVDTQVKEAGPDSDDMDEVADGVHRQQTNGAKSTKIRSQNHIRQIPQDMPVAFFATLSSHATHLGVNQPVAFDNVITNVGNAYHNSTGVFTAPVPGIYVFSATILGHQETTHFYFVVNGQFKSQIYVHASDTYETASQTAIFNLKQGDDVFIQNLYADKMVHGNHFSSLSGFILSVDTNELTSQVIG